MTSDADTAALGRYVDHRRHIRRVNRQHMRYWARTIGDRNPRHVNGSAERPMEFGIFQAHPCFLYSAYDTLEGFGYPDRVPILGGASWQWFLPVVDGHELSTEVRLLGESRVRGRHVGDAVRQEIEATYVERTVGRLATVTSTLFLVDPEEARTTRKYQGWQRTRYTDEDLVEIERAYDAEAGQSHEPRYVDDVRVGEQLPRLVRGPITSEETTIFVGATNPVAGLEEFTSRRLGRLEAAFIHPVSSAYESFAAGCVDDISAQQLGFPAAHDLGIDRVAHAATMLVNWMGARGRLEGLDLRLQAPVMLGDTSWFEGRVMHTSPIDGDHGRVGVEITVRNQRGEITARGSALVVLDRLKTTEAVR